jgi:hypothetical protein
MTLAQLQQAMSQSKLAQDKLEWEKQQPVVVGPEAALVSRSGGTPIFTNTNQRGNSQGTQTERAFRGLATAQRKVNSGIQLTPEEELDTEVFRAVLSQERLVTDPATGQQSLIKPLTIPSTITVGMPRQNQPIAPNQQGAMSSAASTAGISADAALTQGPRPMPTQPGAPTNTAPRKPLDQASEKELQGFSDASSQMDDLFRGFQPTYGGFLLDSIANAAMTAGRRLPDSVLAKFKQEGLPEQANWWQKYYNWANDIRAAKFGLTLTGNELLAFERSTPKPSDSPKSIQTALQEQMRILADKQKSRIAGLTAGGYNPSQISETAGPTRRAFETEQEALDAVRSGQVSTGIPGIPKDVLNMPKNKVFNIDGIGSVRGILRNDGKYYVTQGGRTFRVEE